MFPTVRQSWNNICGTEIKKDWNWNFANRNLLTRIHVKDAVLVAKQNTR